MNYVVHALAWDSHATWCLGYPERALDGALAAVDFARECKEPFNRALAITYLAMLQMWCADAYTCLACAEEARTFAAEYQAPYYYAYADIVRCYAQAVISPGVDHVSGLRDAIHRFTDSGARTRLPVYYSLLADACVRAGQLDEGLGAVDLAFEQARRSNERWWDAEIHRLRGELLWARGAQERDVDGAFQCAREIAQMQQARSLELRAATSLARFRQERARAPDARRCLSEVFDGFAEGFDTPDLQAARALLAGI